MHIFITYFVLPLFRRGGEGGGWSLQILALFWRISKPIGEGGVILNRRVPDFFEDIKNTKGNFIFSAFVSKMHIFNMGSHLCRTMFSDICD